MKFIEMNIGVWYMKKYIYLFVVIIAILATGCSQRTKMTNFIPSPTPSPEQESSDTVEDTESDSETNTDETPSDKPIDLRKTTIKFVKLGEYGATLNIRKAPSTDSEKVGYLVHTEKVHVIDIVDGWASIVVDGKVCYVKAEYLVEERPAYIDPPTVTPTPEPTPTPEVNQENTGEEDTNTTTDENADTSTQDPNAPPEV
jgi:uncharacterized protein YgiM (DUF1202 family)